MENNTPVDTLLHTLEFKENLPTLDTHAFGESPHKIEGEVLEFLHRCHDRNERHARIIFGRGGRGVLRTAVLAGLENDMKKSPEVRLVEAYKIEDFVTKGGSCVVILSE